MDVNSEELGSAMKEMEEINREERVDKAVTTHQVFVAIGSVMEDQTGVAPPKPRDNGKGPADDADNGQAKAMPLPAIPVQQPQELPTAPSKSVATTIYVYSCPNHSS